MCVVVGYKPGFVDQSKKDRVQGLGILLTVPRVLVLVGNKERFGAWWKRELRRYYRRLRKIDLFYN